MDEYRMDPKEVDEFVMPARQFLDHATTTHLSRERLKEIFLRQEHWVFAMTSECMDVAVGIVKLHHERCGTPIEMVTACCLAGRPIFFAFPKESLAFYEIDQVLNIEMPISKEEAEKRAFFSLSVKDPAGLNHALQAWVHCDHLVN